MVSSDTSHTGLAVGALLLCLAVFFYTVFTRKRTSEELQVMDETETTVNNLALFFTACCAYGYEGYNALSLARRMPYLYPVLRPALRELVDRLGCNVYSLGELGDTDRCMALFKEVTAELEATERVIHGDVYQSIAYEHRSGMPEAWRNILCERVTLLHPQHCIRMFTATSQYLVP